MDSNIETNISFRFLDLTESQAGTIRKTELQASFGTHHKTNKITCLIPLNNKNAKDLISLVELHFPENEETDIFISFVTEYDTRIIDIPSFVNQIIKRIETKLTVSYTIV